MNAVMERYSDKYICFQFDKLYKFTQSQYPGKLSTGFNIFVKVIWRRDVGQYQINVETTLCMPTLKFIMLNNVKSMLSISKLTLTTLDNVETMLSSFITFINLEQRCEYDHFQKVEKSQKYFQEQRYTNKFVLDHFQAWTHPKSFMKLTKHG